MFAFWHLTKDHFAPAMSNNNYHPKSTVIETGVFNRVGYGGLPSTLSALIQSPIWSKNPWELAPKTQLNSIGQELLDEISGNSKKIYCGDPVRNGFPLACASATDLQTVANESFDLVITDPPFGGLLHYSELSDFFYVWLRLALKDRYPAYFTNEYTPKALEAVANRARQPDDSDAHYQRLLTACWREAHRILKPGGLLAFTFHHSEPQAWVAVLESLFDAGFYLEATYPIRSDETKGEGEFGSKQIEYDIVHVCRKRMEEPLPVSWARMRREVITDVRQLQTILESHKQQGLPAADLQVIKLGKALEYFSKQYGKVYVDEGRPFTIKDALLGINQLLDEDGTHAQDPPPSVAEPFTRQLLRLFAGTTELARDQMQKYLRGTGLSPSEFVERGWCQEVSKVFHLISPLDIARDWQGKHRRRLTSDYDQTAVLIGACHDASGISASDTLRNENFKPHPALGALLTWHTKHGGTQTIRNAAARAQHIYQDWERHNPDQVKQLHLFNAAE